MTEGWLRRRGRCIGGRGGRRRGPVPRTPFLALAGRRDCLEILRGFDESIRRVMRKGWRHKGQCWLLVDEVRWSRPVFVCSRRSAGSAARCGSRYTLVGRESPRIGAHASPYIRNCTVTYINIYYSSFLCSYSYVFHSYLRVCYISITYKYNIQVDVLIYWCGLERHPRSLV